MKKKTFVLLLALVLIAGAAVGGTLAWLTDTTDAVQNTFTTSDIKIELAESENLDLKMVPGCTIAKDPKVTVKAGSEKCYLFVKIEELNKFRDFMTYDMAVESNGTAIWTELTGVNGVNGVYYRVVDASTADQVFYVLKGDTTYPNGLVTVKGEVTKAMMNGLTESTYPTLTFTAYASQYMKNNTAPFTAAEAWANAQPTPPPT